MRVALLAALVAWPACADTVVAKRTIRAQEVITANDIRLDPASTAGAFESVDEVIGQEARVAHLPRPRRHGRGALGAPALVERNQIVEIVYATRRAPHQLRRDEPSVAVAGGAHPRDERRFPFDALRHDRAGRHHTGEQVRKTMLRHLGLIGLALAAGACARVDHIGKPPDFTPAQAARNGLR